MIGHSQCTARGVSFTKRLPGLYPGDILFFLRDIPIVAALALQQHQKRGELHPRLGYLDFTLVLAWWTFIYVFFVLAWIYATPSLPQYNHNFNLVTNTQNFVIVIGLIAFWLQSKGAWKTAYFHLLGASTLYMLSALVIDVRNDIGDYYTGSLYDLPLIASFFWFALAGLIAYLHRANMDAALAEDSFDSDDDLARTVHGWPARLAMAAVISLSLLALYSLYFDRGEQKVRDFRLITTMVAALPLAALIFVRSHLAESDRARLLLRSEQALENLKRLQAQLVQTEKLVSLGQLAAGAAHEINNPLAAILGFSDLLADDESLPPKARATASKIREQARRTKTLVGNLLSFARQVPTERTLMDINTVVSNAVQLRELDLRSSTTRIELQLESVLPGVRGDGNQLMQVFFNLISNAIDAMEGHKGGVLTIKTLRDRGNVVILFSNVHGSRDAGNRHSDAKAVPQIRELDGRWRHRSSGRGRPVLWLLGTKRCREINHHQDAHGLARTNLRCHGASRFGLCSASRQRKAPDRRRAGRYGTFRKIDRSGVLAVRRTDVRAGSGHHATTRGRVIGIHAACRPTKDPDRGLLAWHAEGTSPGSRSDSWAVHFVSG